MSEVLETDICVVGAGSGGLSVAAGASQMGARTVLIEGHKMGGDCLNYGCVPSKAMLAAGHAAHAQGHAAAFGVADAAPRVRWADVRGHVRAVIGAIEPHDSVERFEGLGVTVIRDYARFTGPRALEAGGKTIRAKYFVVATGSRPFVPPIPGLDGVSYFTNETVFDNAEPIGHLIVIGGGPIGLEMAQAHRRLGAAVTVVEMAGIMGKDDPEAVEFVRRRLTGEGIALREHTKVTSVEQADAGVRVTVERDGESGVVEGTHLLVAVGRAPNTEKLDLDKAGIEADRRGIKVDAHLKTANRRVFAIGDVAGGLQFTHVAGYHAGIVIRQALFKMLWAKADHSAVPWVTYTDPELAHVGLTEAQAVERLGAEAVRILRWSFAENDRAQAERQTDGMIKVVTDGKGRALGATIVGAHAGELLGPWIMAVAQRQKMGAMAGLVFPYPTLSEVSKRAAGSYFTPSLFSDRTRKVVGALMRFS